MNTAANESNLLPAKQPSRRSLWQTLDTWAFNREEVSPYTGAAKSCLRVLLIMIHEFSITHINLRAAALTYSIILSMVPMLAMSTAVLKGLGSDNQLKLAAERIIRELDPAPTNQQNQAVAQGQNSLTEHLQHAVDTVFAYVERTNFAAIGAFGIIGLLVVVIMVMATVEAAMNAIWHSREGRSIFRKIMDYMALLILLPISINAALAGDAILESEKMMQYLQAIVPSLWMIKMGLKLLPFLFIVISLMVMYLFFPSVKVKTYAAFSGAIFASVFWFLVQKAYIVLQLGVANYNAIYGSFATVPLFLIWLHLGWTFILLGSSLAYAIQYRNHYHHPGKIITPQRSLQLAFDILDTVYINFEHRIPTSLNALNNALHPTGEHVVEHVCKQLIDGGLLKISGDSDEGEYLPATSASQMQPEEVIHLILGYDRLPGEGGKLATSAIKGASQALPVNYYSRQNA